MKAKLILYGWGLSLFCLIGGLGTMEYALERGESDVWLGVVMIGVYVVMSRLASRNQVIVDAEHKRLGRWWMRLFLRMPEIPYWLMILILIGVFLFVIFKG